MLEREAIVAPNTGRIELLDILVADGMVVGPPFALTDKGHCMVESATKLRNPVKLLQRPAGDIMDATTHQLMMQLDHDEWEHIVLCRKADNGALAQIFHQQL